MKTGHGVCWNKSLLLMALLRCNGIPAYFGAIPVKRDFMAPVFGKMSRLINHPYHHCVTHAHLHGEWIVLDAVLDAGTYNALFRPLNVGWGIDWDGENHCRLYTENVLGAPVMHRDVDEAIRTKAGNSELPKFLAVRFNNLVNKRIWKKVRAHDRPAGLKTVLDAEMEPGKAEIVDFRRKKAVRTSLVSPENRP